MNILGENGLFNGASVEEVCTAALFWGESINGEKGGEILIIMKATIVSLLVLLIFGLLAKLKLVRYSSSSSLNDSVPSSCTSTTNSNKLNDSVPSCPTTTNSNNHPNLTSEIISSADLKSLVEDLDDTNLNKDDGQLWEIVVEKRNSLIAYQAKSCKPKNAPLKYLSVTTFENCSAERLRDFYMDNDYRKKWDKTVVDHEQLQVDKSNNTEIGRMIKKFPLLTSREYVLAWRVWESKDGSFYCLSKECEHPSAPRQKKYVRVKFFRSGWCIRKVPGRNASEIRMIHQEDAGLNVEMAKLAFSKGIWSYVVKTDDALRKYLEKYNSQLSLGDTGITLTQKVTQKIFLFALIFLFGYLILPLSVFLKNIMNLTLVILCARGFRDGLWYIYLVSPSNRVLLLFWDGRIKAISIMYTSLSYLRLIYWKLFSERGVYVTWCTNSYMNRLL